jgi:hypothetical protein
VAEHHQSQQAVGRIGRHSAEQVRHQAFQLGTTQP